MKLATSKLPPSGRLKRNDPRPSCSRRWPKLSNKNVSGPPSVPTDPFQVLEVSHSRCPRLPRTRPTSRGPRSGHLPPVVNPGPTSPWLESCEFSMSHGFPSGRLHWISGVIYIPQARDLHDEPHVLAKERLESSISARVHDMTHHRNQGKVMLESPKTHTHIYIYSLLEAAFFLRLPFVGAKKPEVPPPSLLDVPRRLLCDGRQVPGILAPGHTAGRLLGHALPQLLPSRGKTERSRRKGPAHVTRLLSAPLLTVRLLVA